MQINLQMTYTVRHNIVNDRTGQELNGKKRTRRVTQENKTGKTKGELTISLKTEWSTDKVTISTLMVL